MDKRTLVAILLAIVFIIGWQKLVVEKYFPQKKHVAEKQNIEKNAGEIEKQKQAITDTVEQNNEQLIENKDETNSDTLSLSEQTLSNIEVEDYILENEFIKIVFTNKGGVAKSIVLKKYKERNGNPYDLVNKSIEEEKPFLLFLKDKSLENLVFNTDVSGKKITFYADLGGKRITKTFVLKGDYLLNLKIEGMENMLVSLGAGLNSSEKAESRYSTQDEIAYWYDGKVRRISKKKIKKEKIPVEAKWVAIENRYFAKIFTPADGFSKIEPELFNYKEGEKEYSVCAVRVGTKSSFEGDFYLGPKEYERLGALGKTYKELVNFGWFGAFGKWLFILLKWINKYVGNWGWSIVIFTILVRVILFPLNSAGLKSAQKMKELQPKVKAIQEKYKKYGNDMTMKAKMNQELQELYKKEGVNPLGGCLPMLVQIPIFFAIYSLLLNIIDLRMAPWILWIKDLSAHDPYFVLPIAMGVTQLIVQLMTPAAGDKNQQRMMLIMPVVITFVLIYAPAGLLLYWTTNNVFQIFQQLVLNKQMKTAS